MIGLIYGLFIMPICLVFVLWLIFGDPTDSQTLGALLFIALMIVVFMAFATNKGSF
jgi:hypothetical protein